MGVVVDLLEAADPLAFSGLALEELDFLLG